MKTKITLLLSVLFIGLNYVSAQDEDSSTLSIMSEYAKAKNYDAAYKPFMELRKRNPNYSRAIYVYGEDILEDKIEKSSGDEQATYINDLIKLWEERSEERCVGKNISKMWK